MTPVLNQKLDALREYLLHEADKTSYASHMMDADEAFLSQVAKSLKTSLGKKIAKLGVKRGTGTVWLEIEGEDRSDLSVDLTLALHTKSWTDVDVILDGTHASKGRINQTKSFKTGELTPTGAATLVLGHFQ